MVELLSEDFEDDSCYRGEENTVAQTWLVSFEQIRRHNPLAADYLAFILRLEPKMTPVSLLPTAESRKKTLKAVGTLTANSLTLAESDA
jgi:hypothetical protein